MKRLIQQAIGCFGYELRRTITLNGGAPGSETRPIGQLDLFLQDVAARRFLPRGIVDVGANRGNWTRIALSVFPGTPVILIEPQDEMQPQLEALIKEAPQCRVVQAGAGREAGELVQTIYPDTEGSTFLQPREASLQVPERRRKTRIVTIDDILRAEPRFEPDLVKLDIQGFELEALAGGSSLFGRTELFVIEVSLFEFMPKVPLAREVINFMAARNYELYDVVGRCRRSNDGAVGNLDLAFVKSSGMFRKSMNWGPD